MVVIRASWAQGVVPPNGSPSPTKLAADAQHELLQWTEGDKNLIRDLTAKPSEEMIARVQAEAHRMHAYKQAEVRLYEGLQNDLKQDIAVLSRRQGNWREYFATRRRDVDRQLDLLDQDESQLTKEMHAATDKHIAALYEAQLESTRKFKFSLLEESRHVTRAAENNVGAEKLTRDMMAAYNELNSTFQELTSSARESERLLDSYYRELGAILRERAKRTSSSSRAGVAPEVPIGEDHNTPFTGMWNLTAAISEGDRCPDHMTVELLPVSETPQVRLGGNLTASLPRKRDLPAVRLSSNLSGSSNGKYSWSSDGYVQGIIDARIVSQNTIELEWSARTKDNAVVRFCRVRLQRKSAK